MANRLVSLLVDSRTEWALRFTALHAIFYVLFFFPPDPSNALAEKGVIVDWSLPVQLTSGGNLAFYNAGWHAWFGLGCAFAMTMAGCLMSIIFSLLQDNNLGAAYVSLMAMLCVVALPLVSYIGVLNNLRSIAFLLVVVFTEVFYGPILNFRSVFDTKDIWTQVVGPNALPALAYFAICWGVYAFPPWHSATYQMLSLSSQVIGGVAGTLNGAADLLVNSNNGDENMNKKKALRSMANALLQQTNYAGLYVPISLYGDMGIYESSAFYPGQSLPAHTFKRLGTYVDQTVFIVAIQLWALGEVLDKVGVQDEELLKVTAEHLEAAADLAACVASVLACPRKNY